MAMFVSSVDDFYNICCSTACIGPFTHHFCSLFLIAMTHHNLPAEKQLADAKKVPGHPMAILQLIESSTAAEDSVRQAAAIHFKNFIKKSWDEAHEVSQQRKS